MLHVFVRYLLYLLFLLCLYSGVNKELELENAARLVFLSSALYALCIETKINYANQNKGKITLPISPLGRVSLDMSCRSGSFHLKTKKQKSKNNLREEINQFCNSIP